MMAATLPFSILGRLYDTVPQLLRPVEFRAVQTADELRAASHLVYLEHLKRNYVRPNAMQVRLSIYHALPTTTTFIARDRRAGILGTISLLEDSPLGLPMDDSYKNELDELRKRNLHLGEASMLVLNSELFGRKVSTLFHPKKLLLTLRLLKAMFDYLRSSTSVNELVTCVNLKHRALFEFLQLKPLGGPKSYSGANSTSSVARHLNILEAQYNPVSPAHQFFYGEPPSPKAFANRLRLSPTDLRTLFVILSPVLASASRTELDYLKRCYPAYDFTTILQPPIHATA